MKTQNPDSKSPKFFKFLLRITTAAVLVAVFLYCRREHYFDWGDVKAPYIQGVEMSRDNQLGVMEGGDYVCLSAQDARLKLDTCQSESTQMVWYAEADGRNTIFWVVVDGKRLYLAANAAHQAVMAESPTAWDVSAPSESYTFEDGLAPFRLRDPKSGLCLTYTYGEHREPFSNVLVDCDSQVGDVWRAIALFRFSLGD